MFSNFSLSFNDLSEICALLLAAGGFIWVAFEWRGSRIFASKTQVETTFSQLEGKIRTVSNEVQELRTDVEKLPSYQDIQSINRQLADVENKITAVDGKVDRVDAIATRVEHQLNLLIQHQISKEK